MATGYDYFTGAPPITIPPDTHPESAATVENIAELRNFSRTDVQTVYVKGYYQADDGGGGLFYRDVNDTSSTDNHGTVIVDSNSSRWKRDFKHRLNVKWFGAKGDGTTDDTTAVRQALIVGRYVYFPLGTYLLTSSVSVTNPGTHLVGDPGTVIKAKTEFDIILIQRLWDIVVEHLTIEGYANEPGFNGFPGTQGGLNIEQSYNVQVRNCRIQHCSGPGIAFSGKIAVLSSYDGQKTRNFVAAENFIDNCNQGILLFEGAHNVTLKDNIIQKIQTNGIFTDDRSVHDTEALPPHDIDIEGNLLIENCMVGTTQQAAIAVTATQRAVIKGNIIRDAGQATDPISYAHGILLAQSQSNNLTQECVVSNNTIVRASRSGIVLAGAVDNHITDNLIVDPQYNAPSGVNKALIITSATLGDGTVQGSNRNHFANNKVVVNSSQSLVAYGLHIHDSHCTQNIIVNEDYRNVGTPLIDLGTDTVVHNVFNNGDPIGTTKVVETLLGSWDTYTTTDVYDSAPIQTIATLSTAPYRRTIVITGATVGVKTSNTTDGDWRGRLCFKRTDLDQGNWQFQNTGALQQVSGTGYEVLPLHAIIFDVPAGNSVAIGLQVGNGTDAGDTVTVYKSGTYGSVPIQVFKSGLL